MEAVMLRFDQIRGSELTDFAFSVLLYLVFSSAVASPRDLPSALSALVWKGRK